LFSLQWVAHRQKPFAIGVMSRFLDLLKPFVRAGSGIEMGLPKVNVGFVTMCVETKPPRTLV
jgi:hypothetical protein